MQSRPASPAGMKERRKHPARAGFPGFIRMFTEKHQAFIEKHKEFILYAFFGIFTVAVSVGSYDLFYEKLGISALIANVFSWILSVLVAFFTNRKWVFTGTQKQQNLWLQLAGFCEGRLLTLVIEELILFRFITVLGLPGIPVKLGAQVLVIALNYLMSKFWIFRGKKSRTVSYAG